ncbi:MAG TPA: helix-turn-helix domain-containing protein [Nitrospiraceae bacterium]|jgi:excisionase family DNA binding protein|nr:helix-turn-helix domain-containing protein [Nitrospiraceae bacterium]
MRLPLLTVKEVAARLQIKQATVYAWASQGKIPCLKVNGAIRFDADDIEAWLQACRRGAAQAPPSTGKSTWARSEIDRAIAAAKRAVYTARHGEPRPASSPRGKEGIWGS